MRQVVVFRASNRLQARDRRTKSIRQPNSPCGLIVPTIGASRTKPANGSWYDGTRVKFSDDLFGTRSKTFSKTKQRGTTRSVSTEAAGVCVHVGTSLLCTNRSRE